MKKIGEYTCRGQMTVENTLHRIILFDGSFDTAYRLVDFRIAPQDVKTAANDVVGKVVTDDTTAGSIVDGGIWNWDDNREIAWCSTEMRVSFGPSFTNLTIDPDNLIVEDVFVTYGYSGTADIPCNYYMRFEKYDITDSQGALAMVRARSQA